jgi:uncharacterized protein YbcI
MCRWILQGAISRLQLLAEKMVVIRLRNEISPVSASVTQGTNDGGMWKNMRTLGVARVTE